MKTPGKLLNKSKSGIDPEKIEKYYGHGAGDYSSEWHSHNYRNEDPEAHRYICPMNCEGGKAYDKPGNCPVCNMKLLPAGGQKK